MKNERLLIWRSGFVSLARSTSRAKSDVVARRRSDTAAQRRYKFWSSIERVLENTRSIELCVRVLNLYYQIVRCMI